MEAETERVLKRLSVDFDSAVAREEEVGAADLARSLAAGRDRHSLIAGGAQVISPSGPAVVRELGLDYCVTGGPSPWVIPLEVAEVLVLHGARPRERGDRLVSALRRLGRQSPQVDVFLDSGRRRGLLVGVGPDHLRLGSAIGEVAVSLTTVRAIRFAREG